MPETSKCFGLKMHQTSKCFGLKMHQTSKCFFSCGICGICGINKAARASPSTLAHPVGGGPLAGLKTYLIFLHLKHIQHEKSIPIKHFISCGICGICRINKAARGFDTNPIFRHFQQIRHEKWNLKILDTSCLFLMAYT